MVDHVHELLAQATLVLDARRPRDHHVLVGAAEPGRVLLEPVERRVEGPGPAGRHVVVGKFGAPGFVELHLHVHGRLHAVEERDLAERAFRPAFGTGAVVAVLVDDERVVELAEILEVLDHAADLVVVVGDIGGEDLHLADVELLRLGAQLVPRRQDVSGPGRQFLILGNHAELLLVLEDPLAQLLVAIVEQVHGVDLVHPFLGRVVRRVRGAGAVVEKDRLAGVGLVDPVHPVDGVIGHRGDQVPGALLAGDRPDLRLRIRAIHLQSARVTDEGIDLRRVAEQVRPPLVGVAADEAVEVVEAQAGRPLGERPGLAGFVGRRVVVLAEPRRRVAVVAQDAADRRIVRADDAVVAGEAGGLLGDHAEADRVVVAPGDQRGARRRAQRGGEDAVVAQTVLRDAVHRSASG